MLVKKLLELHFRCWFLCILWYHGIKFTCFHEIDGDIDPSDEFPSKENLWKGGPLRVEFEPLADSLVLQDVKGAETVLERPQSLEELASELALRLLWGALYEHKELRLRGNHVFDLTESLLFLLFEPLLIEFILNFDNLTQFLWRRVLNKLRLNFVRMK
jgi:hypothetical protein